jgi:hypothetical protein
MTLLPTEEDKRFSRELEKAFSNLPASTAMNIVNSVQPGTAFVYPSSAGSFASQSNPPSDFFSRRIGQLTTKLSPHNVRDWNAPDVRNDMRELQQLMNIQQIQQSNHLKAQSLQADLEGRQFELETARKQQRLQEAEFARQRQLPGTTALAPVVGGKEFVKAGTFTGSDGRTVEVPVYGTVTPAIREAQNSYLRGQMSAPSEKMFTHDAPEIDSADKAASLIQQVSAVPEMNVQGEQARRNVMSILEGAREAYREREEPKPQKQPKPPYTRPQWASHYERLRRQQVQNTDESGNPVFDRHRKPVMRNRTDNEALDMMAQMGMPWLPEWGERGQSAGVARQFKPVNPANKKDLDAIMSNLESSDDPVLELKTGIQEIESGERGDLAHLLDELYELLKHYEGV